MSEHDLRQHAGMEQQKSSQGSFWASRAFFVFLAFAAIAVTLLWSEHRAHFLGALPFLFLIACPLLHLFGGHGSHGGHNAGTSRGQPAASNKGVRS